MDITLDTDFTMGVCEEIDECKFEAIDDGIYGAVDTFVDLLQEQGYSEEDAKKLAKSFLGELEVSDWSLVDGITSAMQEIVEKNALEFFKSRLEKITK